LREGEGRIGKERNVADGERENEISRRKVKPKILHGYENLNRGDTEEWSNLGRFVQKGNIPGKGRAKETNIKGKEIQFNHISPLVKKEQGKANQPGLRKARQKLRQQKEQIAEANLAAVDLKYVNQSWNDR